MKSENRLHNLDYLRGLAALGIMIYHYLLFLYGSFESDTFMSRIGLYGVSIFYILSGLTLYYVYFDKLSPTFLQLKSFYIKRVFRIFPLLWLVIIATVIINKKIPDGYILFLNFTGLFGILKWDAYIGTGVWSIGNELVFYLFFPVFIYLYKHIKVLFFVLGIVLLSVFLWFAYFQLNDKNTIVEQWSIYINPLNQVFLFLGGFLMGLYLNKYTISPLLNHLILITSILLFIFFPVYGNSIHLVSGHNRIIFVGVCFLICFSFYKNTFKFPSIINKYLTALGEASYSVYLIHPIIWFIFGFVIKIVSQHIYPVPDLLRILCSVLLTLLTSQFLYKKFEKYFMETGRKISNRIISKEA